MHVLATRLFPPRKEGELISRQATRDLLQELGSRRLLLVKAPAGYGKTTLMVECFWELRRLGRAVLWISLNEFDGSLTELADHLEQALMDVGAPALERLGVDPTNSGQQAVAQLGSVFCHAMQVSAAPLYVFLDDQHAIHGTTAEQLLAFLVREAPDQVHWIVGSRRNPGFAISRLRALGQLAEFGTTALSFTLEESRKMLSLELRRVVSDELARLTYERTEGWPAGLQMVSIALQRAPDEGKFVDRLSGDQRDIAGFLSDDVFDQLDSQVQSFLLHVCIARRFCPALCDALSGLGNARAMIDILESSSLFIFSLDEERNWYRFHHLFEGYLVRMLRDRRPGLEQELHRRASRWLAENGLLVEALQHALRSEDWRFAAGQLDRWWELLHRRGLFVTTEKWAAALPTEVLNEFPRVQLWRAFYMSVERRFDEARQLLENVAATLDRLTADPGSEAAQLRGWRRLLLHRRIVLAKFTDDLGSVETLVGELQRELQATPDHYLEGTAQMMMMVARREQYRLAESNALDACSMELLRRSGNEPIQIWQHCMAGPALIQNGEIEHAIERYRAAVEVALRVLGPGEQALAAIPMTLMADAMAERGDFDEARQLYARAESFGSGVGLVEHMVAAYVGRARLLAYDGQAAQSQALLRRGLELAQTNSYERLRWHVMHEKIRQAVAEGDTLKAQRLASDAGLPDDESTLRPSAAVTTMHEVMAMAWARNAIAMGRHGQALRLLKAWLVHLEARSAVASQVRVGLLLARCLHAMGDGRAALRSMHQVLRLASPGMVFTILVEREPLRALALKALEVDLAPGAADNKFQSRLRAALGASPAARAPDPVVVPSGYTGVADTTAPSDRLTPREIDILRCVSRSLLNKEIADGLGLTEGSVKWYMQQIYDKLGVRRRSRAVDKARALGYVQ